MNRLEMSKRPHSYCGETVSVKTGCGTIFITVNVDATGYPVETFARGKGGCMAVSLEALGKAVSIGLRCGVDATEYIDQFKHIICPSVGWDNGVRVSSCAAALGIALKEVLTKFNARESEPSAIVPSPRTTVPQPTATSGPVSVDHGADSDEDSPSVMVGGGIGCAGDDDEARDAVAVMREQMAERERLGLR